MNAATTAERPANFFTHQAQARRRTSVLLVYYVIAVAATMFAVYCAVRIAFAFTLEREALRMEFVDPKLLLWTSMATLLIVIGGSLLRIFELRSGGRAVAQMMGGELVLPQPADPALQQLRNIVEEMSIASGVPVPEVFVLENERGINAFAAGYTTGDAAVAVTRGALERLTRDELQGVIAHEFSHILNGDMRLNIRLLGLLHGLFGIYLAGRLLLELTSHTRSSDRKSGGAIIALLLFGALLTAIGYLGVLMARIIQAAVSRQREFLADASAVQFTRNPSGLSGALKKIGGFSAGSRLRSGQTDAVSHFLFSSGMSGSWNDMFSTHPPLEERVRRLEPEFDGKFPHIADEEPEQVRVSRIATRAGVPADWQTVAAAPLIRASAMTRRAGQTAPVRYAAGVLESIPVALRDATSTPWSATALVFAFLLGETSETRALQLRQIAEFNEGLAAETQACAAQAAPLDRRARLPLVSLAMPALRQLSRQQWQKIRALLDELVACDKQVDFFEFVVKKIVERHVDSRWNAREGAVVQYYSFTPLANDFAVILSALANCGSNSSDDIRAAFTRGLGKLPMFEGVRLLSANICGIDQVDRALSRFAQAVPHVKKTLLDACAEAVAADRLINSNEAELLRAIADALDVPMPPVVEGV
jgi:Zn-dependent protease with chaperone function